MLIAAILASSMGFIDGSVVSLAMPAIRADLGASLADAQWINNSYMLFLSALVLLGGAAGDVFGVRRVFILGIVLFVATSLACANSPNPSTLIFMRAAQGMGAALMVPGSLSIIAKFYPPESRGRAIGTWAAFSSLTMALGPFLGGLVLSFGDPWMWRLIFAINLPIGVVALAMLLARVPADRSGKSRRLDFGGAALATGSLGAIAWGLTAAGETSVGSAVGPIGWIAAGLLLGGLFLWWEMTVKEPMVRLGLFRSKAFSGANLYTLILFFAFSAILFFLPMTLVTAWGVTEWQVSVALLPLALLIAGLSGFSGRVADRYGPRAILTAGAVLVGLSYLGLVAAIATQDLWTAVFPALILQGLGMALLVSPLSTAVMIATPDDEAGLASGINNAIARGSGLIAIAALGTMATIDFRHVAGNEAGLEFGDPGSGQTQEGLAGSNAAFQAIAAVSAAMCFAGAAIAWFTQPSWRNPPVVSGISDGSAARDLEP